MMKLAVALMLVVLVAGCAAKETAKQAPEAADNTEAADSTETGGL